MVATQGSDIAVGNQIVVSDVENMIPIVNSPDDVVYYFGSTGNTITWEIADDNPAYRVILKDDTLLEAVDWVDNNESVIVDVDGLNIGAYKYEILACDGTYNTSDIVLVTVLSNSLTPHTPFSVSNNAQLASYALSESWSGNGTVSNPYIIEGYIFDVTTTGIGIHSTTVYFTIRNCTFLSAGVDYSAGIDLQGAMNGEITNCTFTKLWTGVIVWSSESILWKFNLFSSLSYGIRLQDSINCGVTWNKFYTGGLTITGFQAENWIHNINNNQVNGKPLGYFNGISGIHIDGNEYGQLLVTNSTDSWIEGGNFDNVGNPVQIGHSLGCIIEATEINHCACAIYTERSNNTYIFANVAQDIMEFGIQINESANCVVMNCNVSNAEYVGILVMMSYNTSLFYNLVINCGDPAIAVFESEESSIHNNFVEYNEGTGIELGGSTHSCIENNIVKHNSGKGIQISWGEYYTIYQNEIGFNLAGNAYDDGSNNAWDDGVSIGNKWSDYGGSGYYYINGTAGSVDHYPSSFEISEVPTIDHPPDLTYMFGTTGHYITWSAYSSDPSFYIVYKDGSVFVNTIWFGSNVNVNVDALTIGTFTFTIIVGDTFGQNATDTVVVNVVSDTTTPVITPTTTSTTTATTNSTTNDNTLQQMSLIISIGSVGVIIIVIVLVLRNMKGPGQYS
jgi:parallel beta-helix repeat protein